MPAGRIVGGAVLAALAVTGLFVTPQRLSAADPQAAPLELDVAPPLPRGIAIERDGPPLVLDERFDDDRSLPPHAAEVHRTVLRAKLDPVSHIVEGEAEVVFHSPADVPVNELSFHLYLNAFKNERSDFLRGQLGVGRGGSLPSDWGHLDLRELSVVGGDGAAHDLRASLRPSVAGSEDETDMTVTLPQPLPAHGALRLRMAFTAKLPSVVERTGHHGTFHLVGQWFPKLARLTPQGKWERFSFHRFTEFAADFGRYEATLDVPAGYVVGATGERVETRIENGRNVSRWVQEDVHDFVFTAWDGFRERVSTIDGVTVRQLFPATHEPAVERELSALRSAIPCYGRRFGRYPYRTLTVVRPPDGAEEAGGMEYPTLITTGGPWLGPPGVRFAESLAVHEFGHQHFFGLLASNEQRSPFLDEGLNSFAEDLCLAEAYGEGTAVSSPFFRLDTVQMHRARSLSVGQDHPIGGPAPSFPTSRHYSGLVYARTATLLHTLRRVYGEELFDRTLGRYARAYRFRHPTPADFLEAIQQGLGDGAAENTRKALYERGFVDYAVTHLVSVKERAPSGVFDREAGRRETVAGTETGGYTGSVVVVRRGTLAFPVEIQLSFADGTSRRIRWNGQAEWVRAPVSSRSELVRAEVDPDDRILLDERRDNDAMGMRTHHIAPRVWESTAFIVALAELLASP